MGYLSPTDQSLKVLQESQHKGPLLMLNLLRYRETADYSPYPALSPPQALSGRAAYQRYMEASAPLLAKAGGEVVYIGKGAPAFIGPEDECWDLVLLIRYPTIEAFFSFTSNPDYQAIVGHRMAALEDSRLLPTSAIGH